MKIFVDTDSDIRLVRRLRRDITDRGRDIEGVIKQYNKFVKPAFEQYIEPTMRLADIVVPRGALKKKKKTTLTAGLLFFAIILFPVVNIALPNKPLLIFSCFLSFLHSGGGNMVAIDLIVQHVHSQLEEVQTYLHIHAHARRHARTHRHTPSLVCNYM